MAVRREHQIIGGEEGFVRAGGAEGEFAGGLGVDDFILPILWIVFILSIFLPSLITALSMECWLLSRRREDGSVKDGLIQCEHCLFDAQLGKHRAAVVVTLVIIISILKTLL